MSKFKVYSARPFFFFFFFFPLLSLALPSVTVDSLKRDYVSGTQDSGGQMW